MARPKIYSESQLKQKRKEIDSLSIKIIAPKEIKDKFIRYVKSIKGKTQKEILIDLITTNPKFKKYA